MKSVQSHYNSYIEFNRSNSTYYNTFKLDVFILSAINRFLKWKYFWRNYLMLFYYLYWHSVTVPYHRNIYILCISDNLNEKPLWLWSNFSFNERLTLLENCLYFTTILNAVVIVITGMQMNILLWWKKCCIWPWSSIGINMLLFLFAPYCRCS